VLTELADQDLDSIISYIAVQLANPSAATRLLDDIEKCYEFLKTTPEIYEFCRDPRLSEQRYRKAVIHHYILVYKVDEDNKTVTVLRFFYGARDYGKLI
jgi:plasmid stabilization system protein ParE